MHQPAQQAQQHWGAASSPGFGAPLFPTQPRQQTGQPTPQPPQLPEWGPDAPGTQPAPLQTVLPSSNQPGQNQRARKAVRTIPEKQLPLTLSGESERPAVAAVQVAMTGPPKLIFLDFETTGEVIIRDNRDSCCGAKRHVHAW